MRYYENDSLCSSPHTIQWKERQVAIVFCWHFNKLLFCFVENCLGNTTSGTKQEILPQWALISHPLTFVTLAPVKRLTCRVPQLWYSELSSRSSLVKSGSASSALPFRSLTLRVTPGSGTVGLRGGWGCQTPTSVPLPNAWMAFPAKGNKEPVGTG